VTFSDGSNNSLGTAKLNSLGVANLAYMDKLARVASLVLLY
jgi:hypothetical protein